MLEFSEKLALGHIIDIVDNIRSAVKPAFDDGGGPVVVTASRIAVFPQASTLVVSSSGGIMSIYRPGAPVPAAPTSCRVVVYDRHGASHDVGTEAGSCTALSNAERQRVVREARAKLASTLR